MEFKYQFPKIFFKRFAKELPKNLLKDFFKGLTESTPEYNAEKHSNVLLKETQKQFIMEFLEKMIMA